MEANKYLRIGVWFFLVVIVIQSFGVLLEGQSMEGIVC